MIWILWELVVSPYVRANIVDVETRWSLRNVCDAHLVLEEIRRQHAQSSREREAPEDMVD